MPLVAATTQAATTRRCRSVSASCPTIVRRPPSQVPMAAHRSMEMAVHQPIARRTAHAIGRLKGMPPTAVALRKGSAVARRIVRRMAQARRRAPLIRIVRRGRVPVRVRLHRAIATPGRPAATARISRRRARAPRTTATIGRLAATARISRRRARAPRTTATLGRLAATARISRRRAPRTTTTTARLAATARISRHRARAPRTTTTTARRTRTAAVAPMSRRRQQLGSVAFVLCAIAFLLAAEPELLCTEPELLRTFSRVLRTEPHLLSA